MKQLNSFIPGLGLRTEGWCCFPSKLGRIINEQGRPQIGKSWGSASSPDCSGFTLEQLKQLKFDEMDLSEFLSSVKANVTTKTSTYAVTRAQNNAGSGTNSSYYSITPTPVPDAMLEHYGIEG